MSRDAPWSERFLSGPRTQLGRWSVRLLLGFVGLFGAWFLYISVRQIPRPTFFSDPFHAALILPAAACAVAGAVLGAWSVALRAERSVFVILSIAVGAFVVWWGAQEVLMAL